MQMNGLRVYVQALVTTPEGGASVFYSRRGNGPYYRWWYDEQGSQWRPSRVNTSDVTSQMFSTTSWKTIPTSLRTRLGEHYID